MTRKSVAEADLAEFEEILRGSRRATRLVFRCPECGGVFSAERILDEDGERLWGCCPCGLAKAEFSAPPEYVAAPSRRDVNWRDGGNNDVVPLSSC